MVSEAKSDQPNNRFNKVDSLSFPQWKLYNLENDRTELIDRSLQYPEKVREMAQEWLLWANRTNTIPKPK